NGFIGSLHSASERQPWQKPRSTSQAPASPQALWSAEQPVMHTPMRHSVAAGQSSSVRQATQRLLLASHSGVGIAHGGLHGVARSAGGARSGFAAAPSSEEADR